MFYIIRILREAIRFKVNGRGPLRPPQMLKLMYGGTFGVLMTK